MNSLLKLNRINTTQGIQWIAKGFYRSQGYRWELRRNGDLKLGYWRKCLKKRDQRSPYPKRFVLIPGFGDSPLSWHLVILMLLPLLKQQYDEVILFDFPGFGGFLSKERAFPSVDLMMDTVADALDYLKPHTLLGHSLGGWLAGSYASLCGKGKRPISNKLNYSGPQCLILASPSGIYPDDQTMRQFEAIIKRSIGLMPDDHSQPRERFSILKAHLFAREPRWFKYAESHFKKFLSRDDISQFIQSAREDLHTLNEGAKDIRAKTWLIWGDRDTLIPPTCLDTWLRCLGSTQEKPPTAVLLKEAGHSPQVEKPLATALVLGQILSGRLPHRIGNRWWSVVKNEAFA